jgi:hypothetical protein
MQNTGHTGRNLLTNYNTYKVAQYYLPLQTPANFPDRIKKIDFSQFQADLNGKHIIGINVPAIDRNMLNFTSSGQAITLMDADQLSKFTISMFDIRKNNYAINRIPLATLLLSGIANVKKPYTAIDVVPNMAKSYIEVNTINGFTPGTSYSLAFNFFYL